MRNIMKKSKILTCRTSHPVQWRVGGLSVGTTAKLHEDVQIHEAGDVRMTWYETSFQEAR